MSDIKREYVRVQKPKGFGNKSTRVLMDFVNKYGLKGYQLFAVYNNSKGKIFHFRKPAYYK